MSVKQTLADLVAIDSVSQRSNVEITDYLAERCRSQQLSVKRLPYTDANGIEKVNLIALAGTDFSETQPAVQLALVGHTDTVPYDPNWTEALTLTERDGKLFGRGACDTKAFIATALTAVEQIDLAKLRQPLALVFTADEEIGLIGAKRLAETAAIKSRYAIVGEPTSLRPMRAGKGYCLAEVTITGREAHSAYPSLGTSAILGAARLIAALERIGSQLESETHPAFDPPFTTLNVGIVNGGTAKNVIAGNCRFTLEWRPIPGQNPKRLLSLLDEAIAQQTSIDPQFVCEVDAARADNGYETAVDSEIVKLLEELTGNSSGTVAFGTEAAQLTELGAEAVVLGPGDIREAHRTGEYVACAELEAAVTVLHGAITRLCL
jgi:acetylornithine deacetylase